MDLNAFSEGLADAVSKGAEGVVTVNGRSRQPASGIVWKHNLVVTANHVLERDEDLSIRTADGAEHAAELAGRDPGSDLALLRIANADLTPAAFASAAPRVGQMALALGRPNQDGPQASLGIVNAIGGPVKRRRGTLEQYLRTDATPYPGFSGGPLVNLNGEVLGLFTSGLAGGEPIVIPNAVLHKVGEQLGQHGTSKRGFIGISSQTISLPDSQRAGRSQDRGLLIVHVEDQSPAHHGGLLIGDILVGLDGQVVNDASHLQQLLTGERVGKTIAIEVIRGGALQTVQVTVGERT